MHALAQPTQPHKRRRPPPNEPQSNAMSNAAKRPHTNPLKAAEDALAATCANLHPNLATILETSGKTIISTAHKLRNKRQQLDRLNDDSLDFIPRSARFDFQIYASDEARHHADYAKIEDDTKALIASFQLQLKTHISQVTSLECTVLNEQLATDFCKCIHTATTAFTTLFDSNLDTTDTARHILAQYFDQLAFPSFPVERHQTLQIYDILFPSQPPTTPAEGLVITTGGTNCPSCLLATLVDVLTTPMTTYIKTMHHNSVDLKLRALEVIDLTAPATNAAQMVVDHEQSVDATTMRELIQNETTKATKALRSQVAQMKAQIEQLKAGKRLGRDADINQSKKNHKRQDADANKPKKNQRGKDSRGAKGNGSNEDKGKKKNRRSKNSSPKRRRK